MDFLGGIIATAIGAVLLTGAFFIGGDVAEKEVRRKCEQFGVVDLPSAKAMFYCSREPVK